MSSELFMRILGTQSLDIWDEDHIQLARDCSGYYDRMKLLEAFVLHVLCNESVSKSTQELLASVMDTEATR